MTRLPFLLACLAAATVVLGGEQGSGQSGGAASKNEPVTGNAPAKPGDTAAAVEAAKQSRSRRRKSTTKVITNADVKKSKGRLVETETPATPVQPGKPAMTIAAHEAAKRAAAEKERLIASATTAVSELEREALTVEQQYYEENDLDRRDGEIARRFADIQARLEEARQRLAALQDVDSGTDDR